MYLPEPAGFSAIPELPLSKAFILLLATRLVRLANPALLRKKRSRDETKRSTELSDYSSFFSLFTIVPIRAARLCSPISLSVCHCLRLTSFSPATAGCTRRPAVPRQRRLGCDLFPNWKGTSQFSLGIKHSQAIPRGGPIEKFTPLAWLLRH